MTKKLHELFNLPDDAEIVSDELSELPPISDLEEIDEMIGRIDSALPTVRNLDASDKELDELAETATETFNELMNLGMNVEGRYASEILSVASTMFGHALTAKQTKLNKKLKIIELQLKKAKLDMDLAKQAPQNEEAVETAQGQLLNRNDLLSRIFNPPADDKEIKDK